MQHWKEFDAVGVTHSVGHHLSAIADLTERQGYARGVDVARYLDITRGSVSVALKALKSRGLVVEDQNRFLRLSEQGQQIVDKIRARRQWVRRFFEACLGVSPEQAATDACKVEHLLSDEVCERLEAFVRRHGESAKRPRQRASRS